MAAGRSRSRPASRRPAARGRSGPAPARVLPPAPGTAPAPAPAAAPAAQRQAGQQQGQAPRGARPPRAGHAASGLIVGLFLWGFALNWIEGGKPQAWGWVKAKFANQPYQSPSKGKAA